MKCQGYTPAMHYKQPIYSNNPYIGQVDASLIPPPHNVLALIKCICDQEGRGVGLDWDHDDAWGTVLFKSISSPKQYNFTDPLPLLSPDRPGSDPLEPLVLKVSYAGMSNFKHLLLHPNCCTSDIREVFNIY